MEKLRSILDHFIGLGNNNWRTGPNINSPNFGRGTLRAAMRNKGETVDHSGQGLKPESYLNHLKPRNLD